MVFGAVYVPLGSESILRYFKSLRRGIPLDIKVENVTSMPESLLLHPDTIPVFTIRDPRLTIPSANRTLRMMGLPHGAGLLNYFTVTCPIWNRLMYDFYVSRGITPLVIDADDYILDPDFVRQLSRRLGLDPEQLQYVI